MDFESGEVVHIDYTICFDKGQRIRNARPNPCVFLLRHTRHPRNETQGPGARAVPPNANFRGRSRRDWR